MRDNQGSHGKLLSFSSQIKSQCHPQVDEARRFSFPSLNHPPTRATHTPEDLSVLWPFEVALVFGRRATAADYSLGICGWHDEGWVGQPRGSLCWAS